MEYEAKCRWYVLNMSRFGSALKVVPEFRVWDTGKALGYFHPDFPCKGRCLVELSVENWRGDPLELVDTLVHEMAHQLQWERGLPMGHNESFEAFYGAATAPST